MKKSIKLNYIYNLSYQVLLFITPLITTPYISRVLGPNAIGAYSYTQSITTYFILFGCIGLNLYGQRQIAYVQEDIALRSKEFAELAIIRLITVPISLIIFIFLLVLPLSNYRILYLIQTIDIIASIFDITWFYQGLENFKKTVLRNFVVKLLGVAMIFLFVKESKDVYVYAFCYSIPLFLGNILLWIDIKKYVNFKLIRKLDIQKHIKPVVILFLPQIATSVYTVLDKTMIGMLSHLDEEVGYYEQAQKIIRVVMSVVTSLGTVMLPRIASLYAKDDKKQINYYMINSYRFVLLIGAPITCGLMAIAPDFVPWFFGENFSKVIPNLMLISPIIICIGLSGVTGTQYLLSVNRQREYTISVMIGMTVNIIINLFLIPKYLSIGAAVATVLAESCVTIYQLIIVRRELEINVVIKLFFKYISLSVIMGIFVMFLSSFMSPSITSTIIEIIGGAIIYLLLLLIVKDEVIYIFLKRISKVLGRGDF